MNKTVFWDFDGTLVHPNEAFFSSLSDALNRYNYVIESCIIKDFLSVTLSWHRYQRDYIGSSECRD